MAKKQTGGSVRNPNSLSNLRPPWNKQTAAEAGKLSGESKRLNKYSKKKMKAALDYALGAEIKVPPAMIAKFKEFGIPISAREDITKLIIHRAQFKALKDGDVRQLLLLAEFAGYKNDQEEDEMPNNGKIRFEVVVPAEIPQEVKDALGNK